jgi:hypothetical protein
MSTLFRRVLGTAPTALALAAAFAPATPALAFSYLSPAQVQVQQCRQTQSGGDYATSLQVCLAAAATFKAIGDGEKRNPWYSYEIEGEMLEAAAVDYAGLKQHREALDTAVQAHHLLLYVFHMYKMDDDDYANIAAATERLAQFEAAERKRL